MATRFERLEALSHRCNERTKVLIARHRAATGGDLAESDRLFYAIRALFVRWEKITTALTEPAVLVEC